MPSSTASEFETAVRRMTPVAAPDEERAPIVALVQQMTRARLHQFAVGQSKPGSYTLTSPSGDEMVVPPSVVALLKRVIEVLASGDALTVVPVGRELTTQEAADVLNVSRQYLVRLLNENRIPHHKTGTHRRVRVEDLLAFKHQRDGTRATALDDLAKLSQEYGGYGEIPSSNE